MGWKYTPELAQSVDPTEPEFFLLCDDFDLEKIYYNIFEGQLNEVLRGADPTPEDFIQFGLQIQPDGGFVNQLNKPSVLCYNTNKATNFQYQVDAEIFPTYVDSEEIIYDHPSITTFTRVTGDVTEDSKLSIKVDGVFYYHDGTSWVETVDGSDSTMTIIDMRNLTQEQLDTLLFTTTLKKYIIRVYLEGNQYASIISFKTT